MKGLGGGSDCFWVVLAFVLDLGASVGFEGLALKGKDIVAGKMTVQRPRPTEHGVLLGDLKYLSLE